LLARPNVTLAYAAGAAITVIGWADDPVAVPLSVTVRVTV